MDNHLHQRRQFLQLLAATGSLTALGSPLAAIAADQSLVTKYLTDRLTLIRGAGGNVVLFLGNQGMTIIDSGNRDQVSNLLSLVKELGDSAPISTLFNTHWHEDHTGGNETLQAQGAQIIAHVNTGLWLGADFDVEWRGTHHSPRLATALPTETFYESGEKDLGGEIVQYHHFAQAHTDGDIALYFPDSNVMVAGGLMSDGSYPICDIATGGWIGGLISANEAMLAMINDDTVIIPDQGPTRSKADLQVQHAMLTDLFEKMKELARQGFSGHNMLEEGVTANYDADWGNPEEFVLETYRGMWVHTYEMGGFI